MTTEQVMAELESYGNESTRNTWLRHGAKPPFFGVKVGDMKKIVKKIRKDHQLSMDLYRTGNADAMYLAGLIADEKKIGKEDLQEWVKSANWYMISEYTVPWIAAESRFGFELALEWIESPEETVCSSGWTTLSSLVSIKQDDELDVAQLSQLLERVRSTIHQSANRVRYTMNGFVIAAGYVAALTDQALEVAKAIGTVEVDQGGTACKVPDAMSYIQKMKDMGKIGGKRKMARC